MSSKSISCRFQGDLLMALSDEAARQARVRLAAARNDISTFAASVMIHGFCRRSPACRLNDAGSVIFKLSRQPTAWRPVTGVCLIEQPAVIVVRFNRVWWCNIESQLCRSSIQLGRLSDVIMASLECPSLPHAECRIRAVQVVKMSARRRHAADLAA